MKCTGKAVNGPCVLEKGHDSKNYDYDFKLPGWHIASLDEIKDCYMCGTTGFLPIAWYHHTVDVHGWGKEDN